MFPTSGGANCQALDVKAVGTLVRLLISPLLTICCTSSQAKLLANVTSEAASARMTGSHIAWRRTRPAGEGRSAAARSADVADTPMASEAWADEFVLRMS